MFQKSLLKNFVKSFQTPDYKKLYEFVTKNKFIAEDANGAEFLSLLGEFLHWNYKREVKNKTDSKKADGVIFDKKNNPIAIIELKSSNKDIKNRDIIAQAFRYKNEKPTCRYVFISNFKKFDIYIDSSDKCFSIDLTKEENYPTFYALTNQESLETNTLAKLKENSKSQEEITKEVYKKYSEFRLKLIKNLIKNNPNLSKETILHAVNKLLDRFMFILFAEDRGLIPANTIFTIIKHYEETHKWGDETPLYEYYKRYFHFIDVGNKELNIPKYNGNLFKPDELLDNLIIDDEVIKDDLASLSAYDFSEDVDVEVLGHIFEQSLSDLEEIKQNLIENHKIDNKRKKEGVFYTPKFVTEFIIENTLGKLCKEKKEELKLNNTKQKKLKIQKLHIYKEFLENLKIVDPACGSGAFLNAAFRYLLKEHEFIKNELLNSGANLFEFLDVDKEIIEKNLFGVDINEASVGITKLSLWLQTAKRDRALSDLSNNIKCANSLTSNWNELFPEIMANGGFDVVIGNPPYGAKLSNEKDFFKIKSNESAILFMQKAKEILKDKGYHSFIIPKPFLFASTWRKIRNQFIDEIFIILDVGKAWKEVKLEQIVYCIQKNNKFSYYENFVLKSKPVLKEKINKSNIELFGFILNDVNKKEINLAKKIRNNEKLSELSEDFHWGDTFFKDIKNEGTIKVLGGANIQRYEIKGVKGYIDENVKVSKNAFIQKNSILLQRIIAHIKNPTDHIKITGTITNKNYYILNTIQEITLKREISNRYILALLHSKLLNWYIYRFIFAKAIRTFQFSSEVIKNIPIPKINEKDQQPFIKLVDEILSSKEKIKKYKKYLDKLSPTEKIEILEEIEKLENLVDENISKIDNLVYKLYNLSNEEIELIENEGKK